MFQIQKILKNQLCGFVFGEPMVCCPNEEVSEVAVCDINEDLKSKDKIDEISKTKIQKLLYEDEAPECGKRSTDLRDDLRISDGEDAPPGDWPWMALFSYGLIREGVEIFECGGILISLKTVLTSGHCLDKK